MKNRIALCGALIVVGTSQAMAQTAAPPPAWQQGRKADQTTSPLAPVAGKLTATPVSELPIDRLKLPAGFKAEVWSHGTPGARAMARSEGGKIYVGTRGLGRVYEITDNGKERSSRIVVDKLNQPAVAFHKGALYVMAIDKVLRYDGIEQNPTVAPVDLTAKFNLPPEQHHNWKYIRFGPDGKLYVPFGAPCNICELPTQEYAQLRRYDADGSNMEVIARGIRNTQGFDWHPVTQEIWFTDHGRDWLGDDTPDDELNRMSKTGLNFGFPYCHANGLADPDVKKDKPCDGVTLPVKTMGAHAAVMGLHFYTGNMFPADYKNAMFIARKGSWNRTKKSGYDVVMVKANADGTNAQMTPFVTGFLDEKTDAFYGRPVYFMQMPDGALLLSDEQMGAIYRISYAKP